MLRPVEIARRAGVDPETLVLRPTPMQLHWGAHHATLNHQRPLLAGRASSDDWLDGTSLENWSRQLDNRCFFWSARANPDFRGSLAGHGTVRTLSIDSRAAFRRFFYRMSLSPINSGAATRRPSPRGRWLYVPVSAPVGTLRANRTKRGLVKAKDRPKEISITDDLSIADLMEADLRES